MTDQQELFARVYAATLDADEALDTAGYKHSTPESRYECRGRLLRHPAIRVLIDEIRVKVADKFEITQEGILARFRYVYLMAVDDGDWTSATNALKEIAKICGYYEKHNKQKYTQADHDKLKAELEKVGMDFSRVNYPNKN